MRATVVELRYKMKEVLQALRRKEKVTILYHGKPVGDIFPIENKTKKTDLSKLAFFGMYKDMGNKKKDVERIMDELRGPRYRDI